MQLRRANVHAFRLFNQTDMAAILNQHPPIERLSFDVFNLIAHYLSPSDLVNLCRVSRNFNQLFQPMLHKDWQFAWPPNGKKGRYDGQALLGLDFDDNIVSLHLQMFARRGANCSWPIAMKKYVLPFSLSHTRVRTSKALSRKQRSEFLRRLKSCPTFSSLSLTQIRASHDRSPSEGHLPWFQSVVAGFKNLKSLSLVGPGFREAPAVAELIIASPGLRKLEVTNLVGTSHEMQVPLAVCAERVTSFWSHVLRIVSDRLLSSNTAGTRRDGEPFLRLSEFAVDEMAEVDFSTLTDLRTLRTLTLRQMNYNDYQLPSCAWYFIPAAGLCSLRVSNVTEKAVALMRHLCSIQPPCLRDIGISGSYSADSLLESIPNHPWRTLDIMADSLIHSHKPLKLDGSEACAPTLERVSSSWLHHPQVSEAGFRHLDTEVLIFGP